MRRSCKEVWCGMYPAGLICYFICSVNMHQEQEKENGRVGLSDSGNSGRPDSGHPPLQKDRDGSCIAISCVNLLVQVDVACGYGGR